MKNIFIVLLGCIFTCQAHAENKPSVCYGTTQSGHLENSWKLPTNGNNFEAYSSLTAVFGRNYVHSKVHAVVVNSYKALETSAPDKFFIYGESGLKNGGKFSPHKTHQNGLSVDFFVPVINKKGESVKLPISPLNKFGYNIEFSSDATYKDLTIDFEAIAQHLAAINQAAKQQNVGISVVIFDNAFQKKLFATPTGKKLPSLMRFSVRKPWVRHDEHYHIDFDIKCAN